ncbi:hypothetical protein A3J98_00585 [candidate division WS6 bacterium RIFOXYC1_FULL_33_10]|uniref:YggT family protein n=2 Tax=Candidatus Dojkabacteria TaxID=74243 RepID=A0A1F4UFP7_9BACT|nr:MAG: hypothetical protein A2400_02710 [candidate division WS6 bacterium RIFOXYB1_FULL_33_14]OGC45673.1 MAG: hypothetical protein A3J98_00585 [candidate division WS6 bacterium RIFOXYC1_FULL_33_10]
MEYIIYFLFGVLDILLIFRILLKLTGANTSSGFVNLIYDITNIFILPFQGMFSGSSSTTSVFEPSVLIALVVYAFIAWGIVKLIRIFSGEKQD